jgi:CO/xanthine dehydrogenase Mo-binding subunit
MAAQVLRAPLEELVVEDGNIFVNHHPDHKIPFEQMVLGYSYPNGNSIGGPVIGHGRYIAQGLTHLNTETGQGLPALDWTYGAHGIEIRIDTNTGDIQILKVASAFDVGQVLNIQQVETQIVGGVLQGIGSALFEEYVHNAEGRFLNGNFIDYKIPTSKDIPCEVVPICIENPQHDGPFGARGVAEHPMISIPGAIANAIFDAVGVNFFELPLKAERVFLGIKKRGDKPMHNVLAGSDSYLDK